MRKHENRCPKVTSLLPSNRQSNPVPPRTWNNPETFFNDRSKDHGKQPARGVLDETLVPLVPVDCQETKDRAQRILEGLQHDRDSRVQNHSLFLEDLKELGILGGSSEDNKYISMPFEDVHRLVTTMKMAEFILNERIQARRKAKLDISSFNLMRNTVLTCLRCLLKSREQSTSSLESTHSNQWELSKEESHALSKARSCSRHCCLQGRWIGWHSFPYINPNLEVRKGTLSVFSELQAACSSQKTLRELYFHHHDDKKLPENRIRGARSDLGERLTKAAVALTGLTLGNDLQKRNSEATKCRQ
jgi:hypothetical protein